MGTRISDTRPLRIACLYRFDDDGLALASMDRIRFYRMAEALARAGHHVDLLVRNGAATEIAPGLRRVPISKVRWSDYDVIKASIHMGFEETLKRGGGNHPFILASLGSVVGQEPRAGVHFFGDIHRELLDLQMEIAARARAVTILTDENEKAWVDTHGPDMLRLRVPTGVDAVLPEPAADPYQRLGISGRAVLFAGNLYGDRQAEVNRIWVDRLNRLGRALRERGLHLVSMGTGYRGSLDPRFVTDLGPVPVDETWDYQRHAAAGVVLAHGPVQDNESSKIYYYLRTELPVICEEPVPNRWLIEKTGLGAVVPLDDVTTMADAAADFAGESRGENGVASWMASEHSWDERANRYASLFEDAAALRSHRESRGGLIARLPGVANLRRRNAPRSSVAQVALVSPGLSERMTWGERIVLRGLASAIRRTFGAADVQLVDSTAVRSLASRHVDLAVSMCTGPRWPYRVDDLARLVDGVTVLWVANHPHLMDELAAVNVDGFMSNSRRAVELLGRQRPAVWCPLGVDRSVSRVAPQDRYRADVVFLGSGGHGNKRPETTHRYLDPAKAFDFAIWGSNWSHDYWAAVHQDDPERNDWHRFWRGPLPVGDEGPLYSSAGVVLGFHEDGQREWGMWNNRIFEALATEALLICDEPAGLSEEFGDAVILTQGGDQTRDLIERYLADPDERARRGALGRELVMGRYTYDHAAAKLRDLYLQLCEARGMEPVGVAGESRALVS